MALKNLNTSLKELSIEPSAQAWQRVSNNLKRDKPVRFRLNYKLLSVAASMLILLGMSIVYLYDNSYTVELANTPSVDPIVSEFYNIHKSNELLLAYNGK